MTERRTPQVASRKKPKQERSADLVKAILQAAIQVLEVEGAQRFTTTRVAERAGVSVGSVYQYFPNKASILFRLQTDEWRQTSEMLRGILEDAQRPPLERLRALVHAFVRSECDEAAIRIALNDAAPLYRDAPEAKEAKGSGDRGMDGFLKQALPQASDQTRELAGVLIRTTLSAAAKKFSERARLPEEIVAYADAMADMFCAYFKSLSKTGNDRTGAATRWGP